VCLQRKKIAYEKATVDITADLAAAAPAAAAGAHTRSISVATPSTASGGIMRFAKVKPTCLACRCVCYVVLLLALQMS
jgi:hypothetical protein